MKLAGSYPSPYGISVPVHQANDDDEEYVFSADAVAIVGGIYEPAERARFVNDAKATGTMNMDRLAEYGGRRPPRIPLPRPTSPATPGLPAGFDDIPLDAWINAAMDHVRWCDRAEALLEAIGSNFTLHRDDPTFRPMLALGLQILLTAALEHLAETEIECLESAAFYALSVHSEWSAPAIEWLEPVKDTWWRDWVRARPVFAQFAEHSDGLPAWFRGGRS